MNFEAILKFWEKHPYRVIFILVGFALLTMILAYVNGPRTQEDVLGGPTQFGQFGDYLGGILNPIFGFITVCLLLEARKVNDRQAADTKAELKLTRDEYNRQQLENALEALLAKHIELLRKPVDKDFFLGTDLLDPTIEVILKRDELTGDGRAKQLGLGYDANVLPPDLASLVYDLKLTMAYSLNIAKDVLGLTHNRSLQDYWQGRVVAMVKNCTKCGLCSDSYLAEADAILRKAWAANSDPLY